MTAVFSCHPTIRVHTHLPCLSVSISQVYLQQNLVPQNDCHHVTEQRTPSAVGTSCSSWKHCAVDRSQSNGDKRRHLVRCKRLFYPHPLARDLEINISTYRYMIIVLCLNHTHYHVHHGRFSSAIVSQQNSDLFVIDCHIQMIGNICFTFACLEFFAEIADDDGMSATGRCCILVALSFFVCVGLWISELLYSCFVFWVLDLHSGRIRKDA